MWRRAILCFAAILAAFTSSTSASPKGTWTSWRNNPYRNDAKLTSEAQFPSPHSTPTTTLTWLGGMTSGPSTSRCWTSSMRSSSGESNATSPLTKCATLRPNVSRILASSCGWERRGTSKMSKPSSIISSRWTMGMCPTTTSSRTTSSISTKTMRCTLNWGRCLIPPSLISSN